VSIAHGRYGTRLRGCDRVTGIEATDEKTGDMDENYYRRKTTRRNLIIIGAIAVAILIFLGTRMIRDAYYDTCTESFERAPESIIHSYIQSITDNNYVAMSRCWEPEMFYDLGTGCSQICLERIMGTVYTLDEVSLEDSITTPEGRMNIPVMVRITCPGSGDQYTASILLDSIRQDWEWKHWKIIQSDFGGPIAEPWCQ
jgi:hypothetical protein